MPAYRLTLACVWPRPTATGPWPATPAIDARAQSSTDSERSSGSADDPQPGLFARGERSSGSAVGPQPGSIATGPSVGRLVPWLLACALLLPGLATAACTVGGGGGMVFGPINPLALAPVDSTGTITVTCAESTPYSIALVGALGGTGLYGMVGPSDTLHYGLYTDALRSLVWGDGTGGSQTVGGSADALGTSHTVYGRVPSQPLAPAGAYADIITIVVTW
jgi:spore coat protein U-like protein